MGVENVLGYLVLLAAAGVMNPNLLACASTPALQRTCPRPSRKQKQTACGISGSLTSRVPLPWPQDAVGEARMLFGDDFWPVAPAAAMRNSAHARVTGFMPTFFVSAEHSDASNEPSPHATRVLTPLCECASLRHWWSLFAVPAWRRSLLPIFTETIVRMWSVVLQWGRNRRRQIQRVDD
jgi:hypothetical protein